MTATSDLGSFKPARFNAALSSSGPRSMSPAPPPEVRQFRHSDPAPTASPAPSSQASATPTSRTPGRRRRAPPAAAAPTPDPQPAPAATCSSNVSQGVSIILSNPSGSAIPLIASIPGITRACVIPRPDSVTTIATAGSSPPCRTACSIWVPHLSGIDPKISARRRGNGANSSRPPRFQERPRRVRRHPVTNQRNQRGRYRLDNFPVHPGKFPVRQIIIPCSVA